MSEQTVWLPPSLALYSAFCLYWGVSVASHARDAKSFFLAGTAACRRGSSSSRRQALPSRLGLSRLSRHHLIVMVSLREVRQRHHGAACRRVRAAETPVDARQALWLCDARRDAWRILRQRISSYPCSDHRPDLRRAVHGHANQRRRRRARLYLERRFRIASARCGCSAGSFSFTSASAACAQRPM